MHFQVALGVCPQSVLAHARNLHFTSPQGEGFQPSPKETLTLAPSSPSRPQMFFLTDKHFLNLNAYAKPCLVDPWYIPCSLDGAYGHCLDNPQTAIRYAFNRAGSRLFRLYSY